MRQGRWKLVVHYEPLLLTNDHDAGLELFDLQEDLGEYHDLSAEMPERPAELWRQYNAWLTSVGAQQMIKNPGYVPGQEHLDD